MTVCPPFLWNQNLWQNAGRPMSRGQKPMRDAVFGIYLLQPLWDRGRWGRWGWRPWCLRFLALGEGGEG